MTVKRYLYRKWLMLYSKIVREKASPEYIARLHGAGLKVNCWTVDKPEAAEKLIEMGVDFITTNILE